MWSPTHVQVTVYRARNLIIKGKSGTNDSYVTIKLADEKYQTSIKDRSTTPEWMEECDLPMGEMTDTIYLNVHHRNLLGIDEFLGHVDIGLDQFKIYERPRSRWYALRNKPGSKKAEKYRGEIEIKVTFIVQSDSSNNPALAKVAKGFKRSSSIKTLAHSVGEKLTTGKWPSKGSLSNKSGSRPDLSSNLSDSGDRSPTVRKLDKRDLTRSHTILPTSFNNQHLQEEASSHDDVDSTGTNEDSKGHDLERWTNDKSPTSGDLDNDGDLKGLEPLLHNPLMVAKSMFDLSTTTIDEFSGDRSGVQHSDSEQEVENGSENGKSFSKAVSSESSGSDTDDEGVSTESSPDSKRLSGSQFKDVKSPKVIEDTPTNAAAEKITEKSADRTDKYKRMKEVNRRHTVRHNVARAAAHDLHAGILEYKRAQEEKERPLPPEVMDQFNDHSREDLVRLILEQRQMLHKKDTYNRDLEDYIDNLLVKVMEVTPKLLAHPSTRPSPPKTHRNTFNGATHSPSGGHNADTQAPRSPGGSTHQPSTILFVTNHRAEFHQRPGTAPPTSSNQRQAASNTTRNNAINANNSNNFGVISRSLQTSQKSNKKPFNPFKKIQQALK